MIMRCAALRSRALPRSFEPGRPSPSLSLSPMLRCVRDAEILPRDRRDFLGLIIGGGTSQIQKNIISERGLGMPKEPKIAQAGV